MPNGELWLSFLFFWQDKGKVKEITTSTEDYFLERGDFQVASAFPFTCYHLRHTPEPAVWGVSLQTRAQGWVSWGRAWALHHHRDLLTAAEPLATTLSPSNLLCSVESHFAPRPAVIPHLPGSLIYLNSPLYSLLENFLTPSGLFSTPNITLVYLITLLYNYVFALFSFSK